MSDENSIMPELTLEPTQAAAAEAVPELTLESAPAPAAPAQAAPKPEITPVQMDESLLTDQEKKAVEEFSKKIDISDSNMILQYGAAAQKNVAGFSESALSSVKTKDLGDVGKSLSELVVELKGFGEDEEKKGLLGMYILAGKKKLNEYRAGDLETLRKKAEASGKQEDAQAYNDKVQMCERFEKKIHDLELTRMRHGAVRILPRMTEENSADDMDFLLE